MEINMKRIIDDWIRKDLEKSGINIDDFPIIPLTSETELKEKIGFTTIGNTSILDVGGYFIPYPLQEEYFRLKLRYPIKDAKYLSPKGKTNYPYITKEVNDIAKEYNPDHFIIFTEGEKKATKATKEGFATIGLPGVWCFKNSDNDFLPQLGNLYLKYRKCFIAFDSDIISKHNVRHAELRLAVALLNREAIPLSIRFPTKENGDKNGLDDFLVVNGKNEFQKLINKSKSTFEQHLIDGTNIELIIKEVQLIKSKIEQEKILKEIANYRKIPIQVLRDRIKQKINSEEKTEIYREEFTKEEKSKAEALLKSSDILEQMVKITEVSGYVGEEINKKILYFSFTSRLSDNAISCIIKGVSASGKSTLVQSVLNLFPKEDILQFSFITSKALVHSKLDLSHKILFVQESQGAEQAAYSIRTGLSEGEISICLPIKNKDTNNYETIDKRILLKGMVYVGTTTKDQVHDENQTRVFDLYMDESEKQTGLVLMAEAQTIDKIKVEKGARIWRCVQNLLKPFEVFIPYAQELVKIFPKKKVRVRRDFKRFLALIKAHALLYQYQREIKENQIVAIEKDLTAILPLAEKVLIQSLKDISPMQEKVLKIIEDEFENCEFSSKQLHEKIEDRSYRTVKNYLKRFESLGLVEWNGKKGKESRYNLSTSSPSSLPNTLFSLSERLSIKELPSGNANLPNNTQLPNYTQKNEEVESGLGNKAKWGKDDLPNQFNRKINNSNDFNDTLDELGNGASDIVEKKIESDVNSKPKPFISKNGDLVIPFDSDPKYHWWKGGQSVNLIFEEIKK